MKKENMRIYMNNVENFKGEIEITFFSEQWLSKRCPKIEKNGKFFEDLANKLENEAKRFTKNSKEYAELMELSSCYKACRDTIFLAEEQFSADIENVWEEKCENGNTEIKIKIKMSREYCEIFLVELAEVLHVWG